MSSASFGKYRILAALGSDGMADVFLASQEGPTGSGVRRLLVLKRLRQDLLTDADLVALLMEKARISARMNHPNVVQLLDVGEIDGQHYLTTEFLDGQTLHAVRARSRDGGGLRSPLELLILSDVLTALHYAHELEDYDGTPLGIVHGDVTPSNIVVTYDGQVKVVEFGLGNVRAGALRGNPRYMSPEQAAGATFDARADVFAMGVLLWEATTGLSMWGTRGDADVARAIAQGPGPTSPRSVSPNVPDALDAICRRALAPRPVDRYPSAGELKADLDDYLDAAGLRARRRDLSTIVTRLFARERMKLRRKTELLLSDGSSVRPAPLKLPRLNADDPVDAFTRRLAVLTDDEDDDDEGEAVRVAAVDTVPSLDDSVPSLDDSVPSLDDSVPSLDGSVPSLDDEEDEADEADETRVDPRVFGPPPRTASGAPAEHQEPVSAATYTPNDIPSAAPAMPGATRLMWAAAFLAIAGLAVIVWSDVTRARRESAAPVPAALPTEQAPRLVDEPATIAVMLTASPSGARFSIDESAVAGNPYRGRMPRDGQEHVVRVSAPGFISKDAIVPFTKDLVIDVALEPVRAAAAAAAPPPRPAPAVVAPTIVYSAAPATSPVGPRAKALDKSDPW